MAKTNQKKGYRVATAPGKRKNAMESLLERFGEVIDTGAQKMDTGQLRKSEKEFNDAIDRALGKKQRRETA